MIGFVKPSLTPFHAAFWQSKPRQNVVNLADRNVPLYRAVMIDCCHPDYCNSLHSSRVSNRIHQIQNFLSRSMVDAFKFSRITPILKSLHWFKINERIEYRPKLIHLQKFSQPVSLTSCTMCSVFSLLYTDCLHGTGLGSYLLLCVLVFSSYILSRVIDYAFVSRPY